MADLTEDVTDLGEDVDVIENEVTVIFADQIIQDERILTLEVDSEGERLIFYLLSIAVVEKLVIHYTSQQCNPF